jgi:nicotinate-nucleotide--dimethylbenzimidazole phosphoribosyltransferase
MSQVLQHVIAAIGPASQAAASAARDRIRSAGTPVLERLAGALAGAQHASIPRASRRLVVVVAGDHGAGDPGVALGAAHPTVVAARAIADGSAALCHVARPTPIVLVDAGVAEPAHLPSIAIPLGRGPSRDLLREPPMTVVDAVLGLEAGIALSLSLTEPVVQKWGSDPYSVRPAAGSATVTGQLDVPSVVQELGSDPYSVRPAAGSATVSGQLDVLAVGALGVGSEVASAALVAAVTGRSVPLDERDDAAELAMVRALALGGSSGLDLLANLGGPDTAVLAGLLLGAASMNLPVILDGYATGAAALVAATLAPAVTGYLIAAHRGSFTMPAILEHLGLVPAFDVGLGHGEGTGAAMVLPLLDQVAALAAGS